jgi:hypothetical protein
VVGQFDFAFKNNDLQNTEGVNYQAFMAQNQTDPLL